MIRNSELTENTATDRTQVGNQIAGNFQRMNFCEYIMANIVFLKIQ